MLFLGFSPPPMESRKEVPNVVGTGSMLPPGETVGLHEFKGPSKPSSERNIGVKSSVKLT
jgi:hypothetical protein